MSRPKSDVNYGLQADSVSATAIAVGERSRAVVHAGSAPTAAERDAAVEAILRALQALPLSDTQKALLRADVTALRELPPTASSAATAASVMKGFLDKLQLVGVAFDAASKLGPPLKTVAAWLGVSLPI
ncbi:MAG: hypothetical protein ABW252_02715 [Polyangiales bacterium]